jgi:hypothetical protein
LFLLFVLITFFRTPRNPPNQANIRRRKRSKKREKAWKITIIETYSSGIFSIVKFSVPDPDVFGPPGSGSVIYLHGSRSGFGSFHQQAGK